jgi:hypothetical protein
MRYSPRVVTRRRELSREDEPRAGNQIWNEQSTAGDGDRPGGDAPRVIIAATGARAGAKIEKHVSAA